jgi:hypothetical protein
VIISLAGFSLGWLFRVALDYPGVDTSTRRTAGATLIVIAFLSALGMVVVAFVGALISSCGRPPDAVGTATGCFLLAAVSSFMAGVLLLRPRAGWIAGASVIVVDVTLALLAFLIPPVQAGVVMLFLVHAGCTTVATWWARQLRASPDPLPAKAAEASRSLCASWIIVGLLLIVDPHDANLNNTLVSLFVAAAISLILGSGYTRYAEARSDARAQPPGPDGLTALAHRVGRLPRRCAARGSAFARWAARYHENF